MPTSHHTRCCPAAAPAHGCQRVGTSPGGMTLWEHQHSDACGTCHAHWVSDPRCPMLPKVYALLVLDDHPNADAVCIRATLRPDAEADELARRLAIDIVRRLTEPVPDAFDRWSHI